MSLSNWKLAAFLVVFRRHQFTFFSMIKPDANDPPFFPTWICCIKEPNIFWICHNLERTENWRLFDPITSHFFGKTRFTHTSPNISTTPLRQRGFRQCLPFSWTTLRGKHCRHYCRNESFGYVWARSHNLTQIHSGQTAGCENIVEI